VETQLSKTLSIELAELEAAPAELAAIYVPEGGAPSGRGAALWAGIGQDFATVAGLYVFAGKQGQSIDLPLADGDIKRLMVLGAGTDPDAQPAAWRDRGGSLMAKLMAGKAPRASVVIEESAATPETIGAFAAGLRLRHYRFDAYKSRTEDAPPAAMSVTIHVADPEAAKAALARHLAVADGTVFARDLINEPPNVLGPAEFAQRLGALGELGVSVEIIEPAALADLGMRAMLAVAQGSAAAGAAGGDALEGC
jgi:leucyl aminopeptidase